MILFRGLYRIALVAERWKTLIAQVGRISLQHCRRTGEPGDASAVDAAGQDALIHDVEQFTIFLVVVFSGQVILHVTVESRGVAVEYDPMQFPDVDHRDMGGFLASFAANRPP